jgi:hypothetical protein
VRNDPFPSVTMLDLIEGNMRDDEVEEYAGILLEKVRGDQFPSLDHLHRLIELACPSRPDRAGPTEPARPSRRQPTPCSASHFRAAVGDARASHASYTTSASSSRLSSPICDVRRSTEV